MDTSSHTVLGSLKLGDTGTTYATKPGTAETLPISSTFEVAGTSGASCLPRLTTLQRNALDNDVTTVQGGMQVYNTDLLTVSTYIDGSGWFNSSTDTTPPVTDVTGEEDQITSTGGTTPEIGLALFGLGGGVYDYPSSLTLDAYGRAASIEQAPTPIIAKTVSLTAGQVRGLAGAPYEVLPILIGGGHFYSIHKVSVYLGYGSDNVRFVDGGLSSLNLYYLLDAGFAEPILGNEISADLVGNTGSALSIFSAATDPVVKFTGANINTSSILLKNTGAEFTGGGNSHLSLTVWYSVLEFV